uniref:Replication factor A C-terminal domain-containing protein n=1 Tax=Solanum lycopersicum TaxID=4081 RepID=A0A3Q7EFJ2_SOLLC
MILAWNKSSQLNRSYYIINGKLNGPKPNFLSLHKELELAFMNNTEVVCIFLTIKALTGEGRSIRREVIVTNESYRKNNCYLCRYDHKVMTLWGAFAEMEGQILQSLESDKPVLAFCDVKSSIYQVITPVEIGDFVLSKTLVSSLLINPQCEKSFLKNIRNDNMKAEKIDVRLKPSRLMQTVRQVKISNILNGSLKFNATVTDIDSNTDPWYPACNKCYKRVTFINSSSTCTYCRTQDVDKEARIILSFTMFDAAKYYFDCNVKEYVLSTSKKVNHLLYEILSCINNFILFQWKG